MGWYIVFGSVALIIIIYFLIGILIDLHNINEGYKAEMQIYNSDEKYRMWNAKPQKKKMEYLAIKIVLCALSVAPVLIIALAQILTYRGNLQLAETYKYLSQYETYDFGSDYDSLAIKNNVLLKFNDYNESLAKAKTNVNKFPFWTFDSKEIINNLDYLMFK
jgi:hypothetical protein